MRAAWTRHDRQLGNGDWKSITLCISVRLYGLYLFGAIKHFSGTQRRMGTVIKASDVHGRTLLSEAARCYRFPARIVPALPSHDDERQAKASRGHCNRTRTGRVHLGDCLHHFGTPANTSTATPELEEAEPIRSMNSSQLFGRLPTKDAKQRPQSSREPPEQPHTIFNRSNSKKMSAHRPEGNRVKE